jgi:L-amino acid N-acyltransferase YncA
MDIISARAKDASQIQEIIKELVIPKDSKEKTGIVEYSIPKKSTIANRIKNSSFCYVAIDRNKVVGFVLAYEQKVLRKIDKEKDPVIIHFSKLKEKDFIYWDLLGVTKKKQEHDIGRELTKHILKDAKQKEIKGIYAVIVEKPHYNPASTDLLITAGFSRKTGLKVKDITFGIFKKSI